MKQALELLQLLDQEFPHKTGRSSLTVDKSNESGRLMISVPGRAGCPTGRHHFLLEETDLEKSVNTLFQEIRDMTNIANEKRKADRIQAAQELVDDADDCMCCLTETEI